MIRPLNLLDRKEDLPEHCINFIGWNFQFQSPFHCPRFMCPDKKVLPNPGRFHHYQFPTPPYSVSPFSPFAPFGAVTAFALCAAGIKSSNCTLTVGFLLKWRPPKDDSLDTSSSTSRCSVLLSMVLALHTYIESFCTFSTSLTAFIWVLTSVMSASIIPASLLHAPYFR